MDYEALVQRLVGVLRRSRIPYMFVGGLAVNYWGIPRTTFDVDISIGMSAKDVVRLVRPLRRLKFDVHEEDIKLITRIGNTFMTRSPLTEHRVDFWIPRTEFEQHSLGRRRQGSVYGRLSWLISPEDLVLMKLLAGRGKDRGDTAGIIARQGNRLDWRYVTSWAKRLNLSRELARARKERL